MKIIDKKGKLFGLINIIDLLVIVFVIGIVVIGAKRLRSIPTVSSADAKDGMVSFEVNDVRQVTVDNFVVGDPLFEYDKGSLIGEIAEVESEPYTREIDYQGKIINAEVPNKFKVKIKVKAAIKESDDFYVVGGEQLRVGAQTRVKNKRLTTYTTCMGIEIK